MPTHRSVWSSLALALVVLGAIGGCEGSPTAPAVASVVIVTHANSVIAGRTLQVSVIAQDANGSQIPRDQVNVLWTSRNPQIATVSPNGTVLGHMRGVVRIRATVGNAPDEVEISVFPKVPGRPTGLAGRAIVGSSGTRYLLEWSHDGSPAQRTRVEWRSNPDQPWSVPPGYVHPIPEGMATSWSTAPRASAPPPRDFRMRRCDGDAPLESCSGYSQIVTLTRW